MENSLHSAKIESQYFYGSHGSHGSHESKKSLNREKENNIISVKSPFDSNYLSKKENRGGYSRSLEAGIRFDSNKQQSENKNIFDSNAFSEIENRIKRAPKNFVAPQHLPKQQTTRGVKGNLYEALNNLNKELNVKIEKREIPKIRMSLLDFLYSGGDEQQQAIVKKPSKKLDIEDVMENLNNFAKKKDKTTTDLNSNFNRVNVKEREFADEINIEKILENSNLNKSNSFISANNIDHIMHNDNQNLFLSGLRIANEIERNKFVNQMHSNYSSIHAKNSSIPYMKKKKSNTKSVTFDEDQVKNIKKNTKYNTGGDVSVDEFYMKNKISPKRIAVKNVEHNTVENNLAPFNFESNYDTQSLMSNSYNLTEKENLNLFWLDAENLVDSKEKEIFENLIKNNIVLHKRKNLKKEFNSENLFRFEIRQLLKYLKVKDGEYSNLEKENKKLKNEVENLKAEKEIENKNLIIKSSLPNLQYETKIKESESQLNTLFMHNFKIEKENGILKNELVNHKKNKNFILKKFNEEIVEMNKLTEEFYDKFLSIE